MTPVGRGLPGRARPRPFEACVDQRQVDEKVVPLGCGGGERSATLLLMGVEPVKSSTRLGLRRVGPVEPVAAPVDAVSGATDGVGVSSWPSLS
jgi:hypothetical protein